MGEEVEVGGDTNGVGGDSRHAENIRYNATLFGKYDSTGQWSSGSFPIDTEYAYQYVAGASTNYPSE